MITVGDRIRTIREKLELTGEEFGNLLSVTKTAVSNWENNNRKPDSDMIIKIAKLGNVTTDYLLGLTNDPNTNIYKVTVDNEEFKIGIDKNYPHDLKPEQVEQLIKELKSVGFDVQKYIDKIKGEDSSK